MDFRARKLIPYIPATDYDKVATEFLEMYYPDALMNPCRVPIEEIARSGMGLNLKYVQITEELDIYGMTIFTDGYVEIYNPTERLYDRLKVKAKTVLIDSEAVKRTNMGCKNNTIAHECVHWFKHRYYYKMQTYTLSQYAKYCKCHVNQLPYASDDENIMESQAIGIAPKILMPRKSFIEVADSLNIERGKNNRRSIAELAEFFDVSKQSAEIRLHECGIL